MSEEPQASESVGNRIEAVTGTSPRRIILYATLLAAVAFYVSPLYTGLMTAFKTEIGFTRTSPYTPPISFFTLEPWFDGWGQLQGHLTDLDGAMVNSILYTVPATVISAFLGSITAYGLTKIDWRGQLGLLVLIVAGVFIPYQSVLVPLSRFWSQVGLRDLVAGVPVLNEKVALLQLMITHTAYGIPICTVLFRGYYLTIDDSIIESARIDGASFRTIYRRIILPLSIPMFVVTLIFQFTNIWNDLLFAIVLVNDSSSFPVTIALAELQGSFENAFNLQMASAFLAALPTLLVYILFGKQFAKGVAGGQG